MFKSKLFWVAVLLGAMVGFFCFQRGPEGYWYGFMNTDKGNFRINLEVELSSDGTYRAHYDNLDDGAYNKSLQRVSFVGSAFHGEFDPDGIVDLRLDRWRQSLKGAAKWRGNTSFVELKRGKKFLLPRLNLLGTTQMGYRYQVPQKFPDGLETADLRADKADLSRIEEGVGAVLDLGLDRVHSLVLLRHGKLVLDEYFYGYGPQDKQQLFSVTKSVFSTLFGIAQDQGLLNVSQKLYDFFPEYHSQRGWQRKKKQVTLGMLLSMTSGFACDDIGSPSTHAGMTQSQDWVSYCLALPLSHDPGTTWSYNGTSLQPLSFLLAERSGESISQFAREYLYGPLGIVGDNWVRGPRQITEVDAGHWLSARDMAKLGQLYLNRGLWNGKRILSEQWVEQATQRHAATNINFFHGNFDYGYLWYSTPVSWHGKNINTFFADGWGGQYIWLVPDLDLVAVMTAGNGSLEGEFRFFEKYIVNAFN